MKRIFALVLFLKLLALPFASQAEGLVLPRMQLDANSKFIEAPAHQADLISDLPSSVYFFKDAQQSCGLSITSVQNQLHALLDENSIVYAPLIEIFGHVEVTSLLKGLTIIVDDFKDARETYSSIHRPGFIILDCGFGSRLYWQASIAHELAHAMLHTKGLPFFLEEGFAQVIEASVGGIQPNLRLKTLAHGNILPSPLITENPIAAPQNYAMSYLFALYLYEQFQGWSSIKAAVSVQHQKCETAINAFEKILCRMRTEAEIGIISDPYQRLSHDQILRFFSFALVMSLRKFVPYKISPWLAPKLIPQRTVNLAPGQFAIVDSPPSFSSNPPAYKQANSVTELNRKIGIEWYWFKSDGLDNFEIRPLRNADDTASLPAGGNFLVLNTGPASNAINRKTLTSQLSP